ncbi:uncharacterized protein LOC129757112 isoform X2 [Uranotaenia lowii]|uniref:uncharacterized protein LOC129757112 isoform X2 n=1 Tax=Uranotaenia lowii TaxID=190385 RepID=UPI00247A3F38|nr:uncharacterized protein LOC129757112 isoform X2 [Uranotaenia lowii]
MALRFNCSELIIPPSEAHCHQKPLVDYDEKSREMVKFISDVEYFVDHFEATIRQRNVYRRRFDFQLMDIEENLRKLIVKADQAIRIPAPRTDYQLKACCNGVENSLLQISQCYQQLSTCDAIRSGKVGIFSAKVGRIFDHRDPVQ